MTDVVDGFFVNVFFRLKKKKKENSKKSWNIFATKWPAHDKWVKVALSYYKKSGKYSGNQSAKCACDLMLKEIKVETIFSDEKQTHGLERLADGFESIWKIYEERDDHSREAQERYLTKWMKLYNDYRTKFFQNCPSVAEYLDKNVIGESLLSTFIAEFMEDVAVVNKKFERKLRESIDKQAKSHNKCITIKSVAGISCFMLFCLCVC